ncbi:pentatricopeptide repeat-containing protein At5g67570, chloroplastic isoform X2 [Cryptomeria japonica]|uniref:pentatricopeptide repeat-containing protein At5g67570, chloroplastic isoform X2 n=1 Tax=Cryptomeria japonica TaxID=3369 RepID=UPI0027DA15CF|nr:pentatricopeptide repeat-containing protein At5g67570, chloroplastic isoform X2 [Cryptomeria japonica]
MILSKCNTAQTSMPHKFQPAMASRNNSSYSTFWPSNFSTGKKTSLYLSSKPTVFSSFSYCKIVCKIEVDTEKLKRRLVKKGFMPTPKIIHKLRKKEIQKVNRKAKKNPEKEPPPRVKKIMEEEALFEKACREYEMLMAELEDKAENPSIDDGKFREKDSVQSAGEEFSVSDGELRKEEFCVNDGTVTEMKFSLGDGKFTAEEFFAGDGKSSGEGFSASGGKFTGEEISVGDRKFTGEEISVLDEKFAVEEISVAGRISGGDAFSFSDGIYTEDGRKFTEGISVSNRNFKEEISIIDDDGYGNGVDNLFREMEEISVSDDGSDDDNYDDNGVGMEGTLRGRTVEIEEKEDLNSGVGTVWSERHEKTRFSHWADKGVKMEEKSLGRAMGIENSGLEYGVVNYRSEQHEIVRTTRSYERVDRSVFSEELRVIDIDNDLDNKDDSQGVKTEGKSGKFWERAREIENNGVNSFRSERDGRMRAIHADERMKGSVSHIKFTKRISVTDGDGDGDAKGVQMKGRPWERAGKTEKSKGIKSGLSKCMSGRDGRMRAHRSDIDERVNQEDLEDFREMLVKRGNVELQDLHWLLDDELGDDKLGAGNENCSKQEVTERPRGPIDEEKQIQWLTERLDSVNVKMPTWQLSNLMHSARMKFTDGRLVKIIQVLGDLGNWRKAVEVVHWVHNRKRYQYCKGRYVYTTLLAVLGKARRPIEALNVFHAMREHISSYPDMPAYRCIATTLGQAGYLKELLNIIDCLRTGPANLMKNVKFLHWDPRLEPDVVVYNAVMVASGKYELVHMLVEKMEKAGLTPNALTYKAIVRAFRKEKKTDEALRAVEEMKCRGVVPTASVYYELASCLCSAGRWKDALFQVENLCKCPPVKPLVVTFTGLIQCSAEAGHIHDCVSIFKYMQKFCTPNIGTVNVLIKAYGENNMFQEAKALFEGVKKGRIGQQNLGSNASRLSPDTFTYNAMLEACAMAGEWGYLDNVYKQMILNGNSVDQNRHAWLIVAASRAGKSHLLDHAFDQLIEQGKIPHVSLYKEKICQSLQSEEYDKVINYINTMAKGSMEISETEWTELFKITNCITKDRLRHLSDKVNSYVADDDLRSCIFSNLMKSLHLLCGLNTSLEPIKLINNLRMMKYDGQIHSYVNSMPLYSIGENEKVTINIRNRYIMDKIGMQNSKPCMKNDILNPFVSEEKDYDVDNFGDTNLPSADKILMEWRQNVKKKGLVQC